MILPDTITGLRWKTPHMYQDALGARAARYLNCRFNEEWAVEF